ncbi:hypothetical protein CYMTET_53070 [Cymbomonas tetramitiformis]|uniref:1-acyl-sn-glycerol-3-phosphate acyltransferase n=1 Tax=Cymbomonas tetramitiformis TaxID=36881 RepID=A0AAE0BJG1_9CHLO|nr:hypothetical protein CYMTET_53070 [Cymbomonas tetramitiformis]
MIGTNTGSMLRVATPVQACLTGGHAQQRALTRVQVRGRPKPQALRSVTSLRGTAIPLTKSHTLTNVKSVRGLRLKTNASSAAAAASATPEPEPAESTKTAGSPFDVVRAIMFYLSTVAIAVPLFVIMCVIHPFVILFDKYRRRAQHMVNDIWANLTTALFYPIEVEGLENLPEPEQTVVFVANHQSYLDIFSLFRLHRPFKFVSKTSNFLIPIVGWSMFLTGHIPIKRMDKRSQLECLKACRTMLAEGGSVLFFPEGTRSETGEMADFKKGAFSVAAKAKVPVVPITLVGTGKLMGNGNEGSLRSGKVKIVIHPPVSGTNANEMCKESEALIKNELVKYDYLY